mmetsp:Transcript_14674/g.37135  ORF Transcript_14674/g.37135 Transcript_14674/m.37135 type:complete len:293 (-) Transcript_14674:379-1257(-)
MPGQKLLHQWYRPHFKCFRHDGVIRVGKGVVDNLPGLFPREAFLVDEQAHELGNGNRRVRLVQLNRHLVRQVEEGSGALLEPPQDVLERGRDVKVLLPQTQLLPRGVVVARVEHTGQWLRPLLLLDGGIVLAVVEAPQVKLAARLALPKPQVVRVPRVESRDGNVVPQRQHILAPLPHNLLLLPLRHPIRRIRIQIQTRTFLAAVFSPNAIRVNLHAPFFFVFFLQMPIHLHKVLHIGPLHFPGVPLRQPKVRELCLRVADEPLLEHAILVADAVAPRRVVQCRQRVEEARG